MEALEIALEAKFGASGRKLLPKVRALGSVVELRRFLRLLKKAVDIEQVRARLSAARALNWGMT